MILIIRMSLHVSTRVSFHKNSVKQGRAILPVQKEESEPWSGGKS